MGICSVYVIKSNKLLKDNKTIKDNVGYNNEQVNTSENETVKNIDGNHDRVLKIRKIFKDGYNRQNSN